MLKHDSGNPLRPQWTLRYRRGRRTMVSMPRSRMLLSRPYQAQGIYLGTPRRPSKLKRRRSGLMLLIWIAACLVAGVLIGLVLWLLIPVAESWREILTSTFQG